MCSRVMDASLGSGVGLPLSYGQSVSPALATNPDVLNEFPRCWLLLFSKGYAPGKSQSKPLLLELSCYDNARCVQVLSTFKL